MAVEKSYARLGLFLVIAMVVIVATALLFIQRMRSREVIELVTYTQENVAGLDISSAVRYRGVPVGRVSNLQVEPGGRTIEIDFVRHVAANVVRRHCVQQIEATPRHTGGHRPEHLVAGEHIEVAAQVLNVDADVRH